MKNVLLAIASGILLSFGWPTWGFPILLFFGFVPLLLAERSIRLSDKKRKGIRVFLLAYLTFFLWNVIKTNWLWFSSEFGGAFAILVNSLLMAIVFLLFHHFAKRTTFFISSVFLVCLWICFEKMHLNWEFSWPWLNLGNGFSEHITWIQWYAFTGTFGGTLWIWLVNFGVVKSIILYQEHHKKEILIRGGIKTVLYIFVPIAISLILFYTYDESGEKVNIVVLQPNIDPYSEKYNVSNDEIASQLFDLAETKITQETDFVLAPETVFASEERIEVFENGPLATRIRAFNSKYPKLHFLSGVSLYKVFDNPDEVTPQSNLAKSGVYYNTYNSAFMLSAKPKMDVYHKSKLVVGVESTPYVSIIKPLLGDIMLDLGGTVAMKTTQENRGVFWSADQRFKTGPIICYESVYGEFVTGYVRNNANFLSIITNDAWWGETQGHKQHLSLARLRAIETRRGVARSANTGISAFINQKGEITSSLAYNTKGALAGSLFLNEKHTFYVQYGDFIYRIALFVLIGVLLIAFTKRRGEVLS
ncbi:MAG: apolipoprotein N-acyltransferase [Flavobacteriaceae bacterium CG2_30_34_30]|nr:MAG: apolipoprotein N-acyltransferase [Flavobacteriaceae bacterium CG2_30_34_30]